jgi:hypothetical protein
MSLLIVLSISKEAAASSKAQRLRAWLPRFARGPEHRRPGRGDSFGDGAAPTIESPEIRHMKEVLEEERETDVDVVCLLEHGQVLA